MAESVYVYLFPQVCFICVHMPVSGLSSLVQFLYMPATVGDWCAERKPAVWIGLWFGLLLYLWDLVAVQG